jgi:hypothetical protein
MHITETTHMDYIGNLGLHLNATTMNKIAFAKHTFSVVKSLILVNSFSFLV